MRLFLDINSRKFFESLSSSNPISRINLKRRDSLRIDVSFFHHGKTISLADDFTGTIALKKFKDYSGTFMAASYAWEKMPHGDSSIYTFYISLNTIQLEAEFNALTDPSATIQAMLEVEWKNNSATKPELYSSTTLPVTISNDVIVGNESLPTSSIVDMRATQLEAEAGTDNLKYMTPLRVRQSLSHNTNDDISTTALEIDAGTF